MFLHGALMAHSGSCHIQCMLSGEPLKMYQCALGEVVCLFLLTLLIHC